MAMMTTTSPAALITQYQTHFNKELLPRAKEMVVLDQFATKTPFPKNAGAKTIRMHRKLIGSSANVQTLTEGVPLSTYREVSYEYVEATLVQYGELLKQSDILTMTDLINTLRESKDSLSEDAAYHADSVIRNVLAHQSTGGTKYYAQGAANWAALAGGTAAAGALTIQDLLHEMTALKAAHAPRKNGEYIGIVAPEVSFDLMKDTTNYIPFANYLDNSRRLKGEVGKWYNVRIVESNLPFREATGGAEGTFSSTGGIFVNYVVGTGGFGTPLMEGNSPFDPKVYVNQGASKSDPLNQYTIIGFKSYWAALVLNQPWVRSVRSRTTYA